MAGRNRPVQLGLMARGCNRWQSGSKRGNVARFTKRAGLLGAVIHLAMGNTSLVLQLACRNHPGL